MSATTTATAREFKITPEQQRQYREQGYFILERVIPEAHLETLRRELDGAIADVHRKMDEQKTDVLGINHRNKRYFVTLFRETGKLREFLFSDYMEQIVRATIGDTAWLFCEQYVVKAAEIGMQFSWHQDSGYVRLPHKPYVSCWCALDDMTESNGTIYVLPYSRAGTTTRIEHVKDEKTNDLVGYHGDDPGEPVIVPAGSIAVFSSTCFHRSGVNTSSKQRRVYLAQYSPEAILRDGKPIILAEPFLANGKRV
jgi:ectoine hydroxylase-related dioxygenase (phytanoyl-CoA dioxygenase family)